MKSPAPTTEDHATRLKRLHMRMTRRGIKEMDIILGRFAAARLEGLDSATLDALEALLEENDQHLYAWVSGRLAPPPSHRPLIEAIRAVAFGTGGAADDGAAPRKG